MLIVGTVIGSGFSSGKEIAVFFARFGSLSYLFITIAFLMFWGVFYFILQRGKRGVEKLDKSRFFLVITIIVSLVFTASMFAGTTAILKTENTLVNVLLISLLLGICVWVSDKKVEVLSKLNGVLVPFILFALILCLSTKLGGAFLVDKQGGVVGLFYAILYVMLNTSLSSIVIARDSNMSKKENFWLSLLASFILFIMLIIINTALIKNPDCMSSDMPVLSLSGRFSPIMSIAVVVGCLTTLFSLIFTISMSLKSLGCKKLTRLIVSILIPFAVSFVGFGDIISYVYPIVSVIGMLLFGVYFY